MSQIRFDQITTADSNTSNFNVGFFTLKNDGDEAIVRIMHDDISSFDLVTTHPIQLGNRYRRVNCIRDPHESLDNCPMCKAGSKIQQRMYIYLIEYTRDDQGKITPQGRIWERSASYAVTIKNLIDEYGPLSDCIFKIRRNGKAGSMDTTYSILYGNPAVYNNSNYPKDENIFKNYHAVGPVVLDKTFEELSEFLATGEFPQNTRNTTPQSESRENTFTSTQPTIPTRGNVTISTYNNPSGPDSYIDPNTHIVNNETTTTPIQRPIRYY